MQEKIPNFQRVLILQGGGSLGAYEAGVYRAFYEIVTKKDKERGFDNKPLLDIVAGTSIGAINSTVLVSYVKENNTWEGSAERLNAFWEYLSRESVFDQIPGFTEWWDFLHKTNTNIATGEAARRYYASKGFSIVGVPTVFSPLIPQIDTKFLDYQNLWYKFDSGPLKRSLERFVKFPIATTFDEKESLTQPRLILVSVDVAEGTSVTFDSYEKEDGSRKSEYGKYIVKDDGKEVGFSHIIRYDGGITADQVIASASVPLNYGYTTMEVESYNKNKSEYEKNIRYFWDGGIMSNTPLTQVVRLHREYWLRRKGFKDTVPKLNISIVNVHPVKQDTIPWDRDGVINRNNDITFSDRTEREQDFLLLISDYVDLARKLIKTAKEHGLKDDAINDILESKTMNHGMSIRPRKYSDILTGQFEIGKIIRVNRKNDEYTISNKIFDFSSKTINELKESGYNNVQDLTDVEYQGEQF